MGFKVGDSYFSRDGRPGVVVDREAQSSALVIEREGPAFEKTRSFGYVNGLNPDERQAFQSIMQGVREKPATLERVEWLQNQIEGLKTEPKRHVLTRYLESELSHIMNSEGIYPKTFKADDSKI